MGEGLVYFFESFLSFMTPHHLFNILWATQLGIIIGMLPGLTATMGVALLTTLTFNMEPDSAILVLLCLYIGAVYGGSRSAILLNIPGTPANAATSVDGFPLARKGLAGKAIGLATTASFLGSAVGLLVLALFTPLLGDFALKFKSFEFFWLAVFGVVICGNLTSPVSPIKGWIAGFLGLFISTIGGESMHAFNRFSFGSVELSGGIHLIPAMVGAFGFAEILAVMTQKDSNVVHSKIDRVIPRIKDLLKYWKTIIRSGIVGTFIGAVPGVGEDIAAWTSYDLAKRSSKHPEEFGKGSMEGLIASETGNSAAVSGSMIPVLALAIPGSTSAAILLAAMIIHGVQPGPLLMIENPGFIYQVVAMVFLGMTAMMILGVSMVRPLVKVLTIPRENLMPVVFVLCVIGSFAIQARLFDIGVMVVFGIIGYLMKEMDYPIAPLVLGIILGVILDKNFIRALVLSEGDITQFVESPISITIALITFYSLIGRTKIVLLIKRKINQTFRQIFRIAPKIK